MKSLWGDIGKLDIAETPRSILVEQANLLNEKTGGLVRAEVCSDNARNSIAYSLHFVVPSLNNYRFCILRVTHPADLYPVEMIDVIDEKEHHCVCREGLVLFLESILSSRHVHRILHSLYAQAMFGPE